MPNPELLSWVAFVLQDEGVSRLCSQRMARTMLAVLRDGDVVGRGLKVTACVPIDELAATPEDEAFQRMALVNSR